MNILQKFFSNESPVNDENVISYESSKSFIDDKTKSIHGYCSCINCAEPDTCKFYPNKNKTVLNTECTESSCLCYQMKKQSDQYTDWEERYTDPVYLDAALRAYQTCSEAQTIESVLLPFSKQIYDTSKVVNITSDSVYTNFDPFYQKSAGSQANTGSFYSIFGSFYKNKDTKGNLPKKRAEEQESKISRTNRSILYRNDKVIYLTTIGAQAGTSKDNTDNNERQSSHCNSNSASGYQMVKMKESWIPYTKPVEEPPPQTDKCDCVLCEATKCPFKKTAEMGCGCTDRSYLVGKLEEAYNACTCKICECIAGIKAPPLPPVAPPVKIKRIKKKKYKPPKPPKDKEPCKCEPCDCFDCPRISDDVKYPVIEPSPPPSPPEVVPPPPSPPITESLLKVKFYDSLGEGLDPSSVCDCDPCECIVCRKVKPPVEEVVQEEEEEEDEYECIETQTVLTSGGRFNYKCHCEPCECLYCKALAQPDCRCDPCDCYMCQGIRVEEEPLTCDVICHNCKMPPAEAKINARLLCNCAICSCTECNKGDKCSCDPCHCTECLKQPNQGDVKEYCRCKPCECMVCKGREKICKCKYCDCYECDGLKMHVEEPVEQPEEKAELETEAEAEVIDLENPEVELELMAEPEESYEFIEPPPPTDTTHPMCKCNKCECENCSAGGDVCRCSPCDCIVCKSRPIKVLKPKPKPPTPPPEICTASLPCPKSVEEMEYFAFMRNLCVQKEYVYDSFKYITCDEQPCCKCDVCECVQCICKANCMSEKSVRIQEVEESEEDSPDEIFEECIDESVPESLIRVEEPEPKCHCNCYPCECHTCRWGSDDRLLRHKETQSEEPPPPPPTPPPVIIKVMNPKCCCKLCDCEKCTTLEDIVIVHNKKCMCDKCLCDECTLLEQASVVQIVNNNEVSISKPEKKKFPKICENCKCKICEVKECSYLNKRGSGKFDVKPFATNETISDETCLCKPFCPCADCKFTKDKIGLNVCSTCYCENCNNMRCMIAQQRCDCHTICEDECNKNIKRSQTSVGTKTPIPPATKLPVNMQVMCAFTENKKVSRREKPMMVDREINSEPYSCCPKPESIGCSVPCDPPAPTKCEKYCPGKSLVSCVEPIFKEKLPPFYFNVIPDEPESDPEPERSRSNCNCAPCDCIICEPKKPKKIKKKKKKPSPIVLLHQCSCENCECMICEKSPRTRPCTCDECDCEICPNRKRPEPEMVEETTSPAQCECSPCNCCPGCPGPDHSEESGGGGGMPSAQIPMTEVFVITTVRKMKYRTITQGGQYEKKDSTEWSVKEVTPTQRITESTERRAPRYVESVREDYSTTTFMSDFSDLGSASDENLSDFIGSNLSSKNPQGYFINSIEGTVDHLLPPDTDKSSNASPKSRRSVTSSLSYGIAVEVNNIRSCGDTTFSKLIQPGSSLIDNEQQNSGQPNALRISQESIKMKAVTTSENLRNNMLLPIITTIDEDLKFEAKFFREIYSKKYNEPNAKVISNYFNTVNSTYNDFKGIHNILVGKAEVTDLNTAENVLTCDNKIYRKTFIEENQTGPLSSENPTISKSINVDKNIFKLSIIRHDVATSGVDVLEPLQHHTSCSQTRQPDKYNLVQRSDAINNTSVCLLENLQEFTTKDNAKKSEEFNTVENITINEKVNINDTLCITMGNIHNFLKNAASSIIKPEYLKQNYRTNNDILTKTNATLTDINQEKVKEMLLKCNSNEYKNKKLTAKEVNPLNEEVNAALTNINQEKVKEILLKCNSNEYKNKNLTAKEVNPLDEEVNAALTDINQEKVKEMLLKCNLNEHKNKNSMAKEVKALTEEVNSCHKEESPHIQVRGNIIVEPLSPQLNMKKSKNLDALLEECRRLLPAKAERNKNKMHFAYNNSDIENAVDKNKKEIKNITVKTNPDTKKRTLLDINLNSLLYDSNEKKEDMNLAYNSLKKAKYYSEQLTSLVTKYKNEFDNFEPSSKYQDNDIEDQEIISEINDMSIPKRCKTTSLTVPQLQDKFSKSKKQTKNSRLNKLAKSRGEIITFEKSKNMTADLTPTYSTGTIHKKKEKQLSKITPIPYSYIYESDDENYGHSMDESSPSRRIETPLSRKPLMKSRRNTQANIKKLSKEITPIELVQVLPDKSNNERNTTRLARSSAKRSFSINKSNRSGIDGQRRQIENSVQKYTSKGSKILPKSQKRDGPLVKNKDFQDDHETTLETTEYCTNFIELLERQLENIPSKENNQYYDTESKAVSNQIEFKSFVRTSQSDTSGMVSVLPKLRVHVPTEPVPITKTLANEDHSVKYAQDEQNTDKDQITEEDKNTDIHEKDSKVSKVSAKDATKSGMNIGFLALRRISNHSVLVKWNLPKVSDDILGYELLVNGKSVQKIFSPAKCMSVVTCLPTGEKILISIRTLTSEDKSGYPSSTIVYDPKIKYKAINLV